jgi:hypothetical protein
VSADLRILQSALLVTRHQRGDAAAFTELVHLWERPLFYYLRRLAASSNPASTFDLLFVLTFAIVCTAWSLASRITAAELAARENSLRLELRLATLAASFNK